MDTTRDIIIRAHKMTGLIDPTQSIDDVQLLEGLEALNAMLGSWGLDGLPLPQDTRISFSTVANQVDYVISTDAAIGSALTLTYPVEKIETMEYRTNNFDTPIKIVDFVEYDAHSDKSYLNGWYPKEAYIADDVINPNSTKTISFYPIPTMVVTVYMRVRYASDDIPVGAVDSFSVQIPSTLVQAYTYNLAVELASNNPGVVLSPIVLGKAAQEKSKLYRLIAPLPPTVLNVPAGRTP